MAHSAENRDDSLDRSNEGLRREMTAEIEKLRSRAENGDEAAQLGMARLFYNMPEGVHPKTGTRLLKWNDFNAAAHWYRKAAKQGSVEAKYKVGVMYSKGEGLIHGPNFDLASNELKSVIKRVEELILLEEKPSRRDYLGGIINSSGFRLGELYRTGGEAFPADMQSAAKWYEKGAEYGNAASQMQLGLAYLEGSGVPQDFVLAHMWFNLAAAQSQDGAREAREKLTTILTPDQVAEAQRMAREYTRAMKRPN
jgi:hypothetical protein